MPDFLSCECGKPVSVPEGVVKLTADQMGLLGNLGFSMRFVGIVTFILGAVFAVVGVTLVVQMLSTPAAQNTVDTTGIVNSLVPGIMFMLFGGFTARVAASFSEAARWQKTSASNLMAALQGLHELFRAQLIIFCIGIVLILMTLAFQLIVRSTETKKGPMKRAEFGQAISAASDRLG